MSITVATSTADMSWQEVDVVEFTAGTLSTITECITEVQDRIQRGTLTASTVPSTTQVTRWLVRGKEMIAAMRNFSFGRRYAYATTTSGTYRCALPPDYRGGEVTLRDITSGYSPKQMTLVSPTLFDASYPDPSYVTNDRPYVGCVKNMELWLYPPPSGTFSYELEYNRSGADQTTTDVSWLPEFYRWLICDYATWHALAMLKDPEQNTWRASWQEGMLISRTADGKQKFGSQQYQCPVWVR